MDGRDIGTGSSSGRTGEDVILLPAWRQGLRDVMMNYLGEGRERCDLEEIKNGHLRNVIIGI